jgi:hypothetical protein
MSYGPVLRTRSRGRTDTVEDQPDVYGRRDKWDFQNALLALPLLWRYDCGCPADKHYYGCPMDGGCRPESIPDARSAIARLDPVWREVLDALDADPEAYIYWN